jgi:hypothetical protein
MLAKQGAALNFAEECMYWGVNGNLWNDCRSESSASTQSSKGKRLAQLQAVRKFYTLETFHCQIVGPVTDPQKNLTCVHVAPRRVNDGPAISRFEISDIDTTVIFLQHEIEEAFGLGRVAFLDDDSGCLVLEVLDVSLLATEKPLAGTNLTWAQIEHWPLNVPSGLTSPVRRLLANHAAVHIQKFAESLTFAPRL